MEGFVPLIRNKLTIYRRPEGYYVHQPGGECEPLTAEKLTELHKELWMEVLDHETRI